MEWNLNPRFWIDVFLEIPRELDNVMQCNAGLGCRCMHVRCRDWLGDV